MRVYFLETCTKSSQRFILKFQTGNNLTFHEVYNDFLKLWFIITTEYYLIAEKEQTTDVCPQCRLASLKDIILIYEDRHTKNLSV